MSDTAAPTFRELGLPDSLLSALLAVGYEQPSPIQAATLPPLLAGRDVLGQAQTGTGKTAAFALPILARIDVNLKRPQALVLAPTRELAIQVAEAFQKYASHLPGFHVLPIYGGQAYPPQLAGFRRGAQVIVGTPGRVVDHLKRGSFQTESLRHLVLDEADEMLRMGFIEDVEWVLQQAPAERQVALFSATLPTAIRRMAQTYLRDPAQITIEAKTRTATQVRQRHWIVSGASKLEALTRILDAEPFEAMIIFARTKIAVQELAEKLEARGLAAAALHGDVAQAQREKVVAALRDGRLDVVVATDVAARGLDVERITHVVNYDAPHDTESYIHRIGRTGRAGRSGEAILFIAPRERHLLRLIERSTRSPIPAMELPSLADVEARREARFRDQLDAALAEPLPARLMTLIEGYLAGSNRTATELAAALARLALGESLPAERPAPATSAPPPRREREPDAERPASRERPVRSRPPLRSETFHAGAGAGAEGEDEAPPRFETYRVEVGRDHGVKVGNIVGAIANEAGLEARNIGKVQIEADHSYVDLPEGMPKKIFRDLQKVWVSGRQLRIARAETAPPARGPRPPRR